MVAYFKSLDPEFMLNNYRRKKRAAEENLPEEHKVNNIKGDLFRFTIHGEKGTSFQSIYMSIFCLREAQGLEEGSDEGGRGRGIRTVLNFFYF